MGTVQKGDSYFEIFSENNTSLLLKFNKNICSDFFNTGEHVISKDALELFVDLHLPEMVRVNGKLVNSFIDEETYKKVVKYFVMSILQKK